MDTLKVTIYPVEATAISAEICLGETYNLNGFNVTPDVAGTTTHTLNLQTSHDCDSIVTLTLTTHPVKSTNLSAEICLGGTYNLNGFNVTPDVAGTDRKSVV